MAGLFIKRRDLHLKLRETTRCERSLCMHKSKLLSLLTALSFLGGIPVAAQEFDKDSDVKIEVHGHGSFEAGQIVKGMRQYNKVDSLDHIWLQKAIGGIDLAATIKERFKVFTGIEGYLVWGFPQLMEERPTLETTKLFFLTRSDAQYSFGNLEHPFLQVGVGYFPFDYNPDSRNFGEYLFRTGNYPLFFKNEFDLPFTRLLGIRASTDLLDGKLHGDVILNSELDIFPVQDYSLSFLANGKILNGFIDIGAGFQINHLFSVYGGDRAERLGANWTEREIVIHTEVVDSILDPVAGMTYTVDTTALTFSRHKKAMLRLNIDIKKILPMPIFGEEDLKIYMETALIGFQDFPKLYNVTRERMPVVFGLNLPGFKFVDLINTEWEYCSYPHSYSLYWLYYNSDQGAQPAPYASSIAKNPWCWSVYIKKTLFDGHFAFTFQAARDHITLKRYYFTQEDYGQALVKPDNWWWVFKTSYNF
jgi:hypothetical protein